MSKTYLIDIDGTICTQTDGAYENAQPLYDRIEKVNKLFDEGHTIIFWTARGMGRFNGDVNKVYVHFYDLTKYQLEQWGVKHHVLSLGKPMYDHWIDDKAINDKDFFK